MAQELNGRIEMERSFRELFDALDPQTHKRAMKKAVRVQAQFLKGLAMRNVKARLSPQANPQVARNIKVKLYGIKYGLGFWMSVKPQHRVDHHKNRYGKKKPALYWLEYGTAERVSKKNKGRRGKVTPIKALEKAEREGTPHIERNFFKALKQSLDKECQKRGL